MLGNLHKTKDLYVVAWVGPDDEDPSYHYYNLIRGYAEVSKAYRAARFLNRHITVGRFIVDFVSVKNV